MTDPVRRPAAFTPAPRHLRRRAFRADIAPRHMGGFQTSPNDRTVGAVQPEDSNVVSPKLAKAPARTHNMGTADSSRQRKRRIALLIVILVSVSVPILALTLIFGQ